jgi:hypothetical protein
MQLVQISPSQILMHGNSAFQQGSYYSIFVFDSLSLNTISLGMLILQNNPPNGSDTNCNFRFLNFSPGLKIGIMLIYIHDTTFHDTVHIAVRDTVVVAPSSFVGNNPSPAAYPFTNSARAAAHTGVNQVFAYVDSTKPRPDSSNIRRLGTLSFYSPKSYNIYLQNYFFPGPSQDSLQIVSFPVN